jgi:hypothetical protein
MKLQTARILNRNIVADDTLIRFVQFMSFVASIFVLSLSLWKLSRLDLNEFQLFFGVLLSLITLLLLVVIGFLLPMARTVEKA